MVRRTVWFDDEYPPAGADRLRIPAAGYFATLMTTVTLTASENQILVFCSPGRGKGYANGQIVATAVNAID